MLWPTVKVLGQCDIFVGVFVNTLIHFLMIVSYDIIILHLHQYERKKLHFSQPVFRELLSHRNWSTCELSYSDNNHTLKSQGIILPQRIITFLLRSTNQLKDHRVPLSCTQFHPFKIARRLFYFYKTLTRYLQDTLPGMGRYST